MFGIGLGEILLIVAVIFLLSPRDLPRAMRKLGQLVRAVARFREEVTDLGGGREDRPEEKDHDEPKES